MNDFIKYNGITTDVKDHSCEQQVSLFTVKPIKIERDDEKKGYKIQNNIKLFEFRYVPIINLEKQNELKNTYVDYPIINSLLDNLNFLYYSLFERCVKEYTERKGSTRNINSFIDNEIDLIKSKEFTQKFYPLFTEIDFSNINEINTYSIVKSLMHEAITNKIESINFLYYKTVNPLPNSLPTEGFKNLKCVIINNLYWNFIEFLKEQKNDFNSKVNNSAKINDKNRTSKNFAWFKVGVQFAKGEMYDIIEQEFKIKGKSFREIAEDIEEPNYRQIISNSYLDNEKSDRNIFNSYKKIKSIYEYCITNNIKIDERFLKKIKEKNLISEV